MADLQVVYAPARFWEGGARCSVGRFSFGRRMVPEAGAFLIHEEVEHIFKRGQAIPYSVRIAVVPPEARLIRAAVKIRRHEAM